MPVFTLAELDALLATRTGGGFTARRDTAILALFTDTGIRLAEMAGLRIDDVDLPVVADFAIALAGRATSALLATTGAVLSSTAVLAALMAPVVGHAGGSVPGVPAAAPRARAGRAGLDPARAEVYPPPSPPYQLDHDRSGAAHRDPHAPGPCAQTLPRLTTVAEYVRAFAALLVADDNGDLDTHTGRLGEWIAAVRADTTVPALRSFSEGLLIDHDAGAAGRALPYSNEPAIGCGQQDQAAQTPDVRACRLRPPSNR